MTAMLRPGIQRWLQQHCDGSGDVAGGVVILVGNGAPQTVAEWPASGQLTAPLAMAAQAAAQRARPVVVAPAVRLADSAHNRVISLPLKTGGRMWGAVALAVQADDTEAVERLFQNLEQATAHMADPDPDRGDGAPLQIGRVLALQTVLLGQPTLAEGALALATELAAGLGSDRVTLGVGNGTAMDVIAVSNSAEFKPEQALLRLVSAAMQEAADQGERIAYPADATEPARIILAHAELHARTGHAVVSVPLVHAGHVVGALLVEWRSAAAPDAGRVAQCESVAGLIGPLVALRQRAELPWRSALADALRGVWRRIARRDDPWPKTALATLVALVLAATLVPVTYRVGAAARIEGAVQRVVAAPFDGFLQRSHVRPGDTVRAGDLLIEMADQDLTLEQRKWESALTQHENGYAAALARADRAQFVINHGKADEARAQLGLVRQQLARTRLVAPIDAMVIKGDLSQALGAPVQRGDSLLTLAPAEQYRLIVEVDERDIADVRVGQTGQLALASLPSEPLPLVVQRITPVSNVRDGRNVFEVEARLAGAAPALRHGLQGVAKIDAGEQSAAWIWSHRIVDWWRLAWWSWGLG